MAATNQWNENSPKGTDLISSGDDEIRKFKLDVRERANLEHFWGVGLVEDGKHRHITLTPAPNVTAITGGGNTMTSGGGLINLSQTWNNAAAHFDGLRMDITDTASSADSHLIHMTINGVPVLTVSKTGLVLGSGGGGGGDVFNNPVTFASTTHFVGVSQFDQRATFSGGLTAYGDTFFHGNTTFDTGQTTFNGPLPVVFNTPVVFNGLATFNGGTSGVGGGGGGEAFPIGAIFLSVLATNPVTTLGYGSWTRFGQGRMLVGVNEGEAEFATAQQVGGAKTHTLALTEMPRHNHSGWDEGHIHQAHYGAVGDLEQGVTPDFNASGTSAVNVDTGYANVRIGDEGGGLAHNNLPPYITVYMWRRTG
jgi:hypothetical protein